MRTDQLQAADDRASSVNLLQSQLASTQSLIRDMEKQSSVLTSQLDAAGLNVQELESALASAKSVYCVTFHSFVIAHFYFPQKRVGFEKSNR